MGQHKYFTLEELLRSSTALSCKIENLPSWEVVVHLDELVTKILDPLREAWGKAIKATSGFRSEGLNSHIGGSKTSVHQTGYAADLQTGGKFEDFVEFTKNWLLDNDIAFDQLIVETDNNTGARWLHIGLYNNAGEQRRQIKTMTK